VADRPGEFQTIRELFAPLAHPEWGRGLLDDVAVLPTRPGYDLVLTKDALIEGVHFLADDPLDTVARKLLRANLSDLAAKGAEPFGYLLMTAWSGRCGWEERKAFAEGLKADQIRFGVQLLGGDTVSTSGPATFSLTALGWTPKGRTVGRVGARPGDLLFVTGSIGDGWLGLQAAKGLLRLEPERLSTLIAHYRMPSPRVEFAMVVREHASASADVSDGLIADAGHIGEAGGVGLEIDLERMPLSAAGHTWLDARPDPVAALTTLATGGDDYEIVFTAPARAEAALKREAERVRLRLTAIGQATTGTGMLVRHLRKPLELHRTGWAHP